MTRCAGRQATFRRMVRVAQHALDDLCREWTMPSQIFLDKYFEGEVAVERTCSALSRAGSAIFRWEQSGMLATQDASETARSRAQRYVGLGFALSFALAGGLWVYILFWL